MKRPGCWPMSNISWEPSTHRTCSMCSMSSARLVCAPMATKVRAAQKVVTKAQQTLDQVQAQLETTGNEPPPIRAEHSPEAIVRLEQAWQTLDVASREHERLAQQREQVAKSIRAIGQAYHFVDLHRG